MAKKKTANKSLFGKHTRLDLLIILLVGVIAVVWFAKWYNDKVDDALAPIYNHPVQLYNQTPSLTPTVNPY